MSRLPGSLTTALKYIKRNRFLTVSSLFVTSLSLLLALSFYTGLIYSHYILKGLEDKAQITVFFKNSVGEEAINSFRDELLESGEVERVKYISQEEALKIYLGQHQNSPSLLESVSSSILPPSLEIKAKRIGSLEKIAASFKEQSEVDEVVFFRDVVETFRKWSLVLRAVGSSLVLLMLLVSLLIILLSVGISVKVRADEIEIMRLVGASEAQVTQPFLWQGGLYGFGSALVSFLIFLLIWFFSQPYLNYFSAAVALSPNLKYSLIMVFGVHFLVGTFLGILSSYLGVKKYLKV